MMSRGFCHSTRANILYNNTYFHNTRSPVGGYTDSSAGSRLAVWRMDYSQGSWLHFSLRIWLAFPNYDGVRNWRWWLLFTPSETVYLSNVIFKLPFYTSLAYFQSYQICVHGILCIQGFGRVRLKNDRYEI